MLQPGYLSRGEALSILGVKPQTLYSYVSRGLIRRLPQGDGRSSYYLREDVERMKARSAARSGHGAAAASAVHWGEPVLTTSITEITETGPRYRNRLADDLASAGPSFEAVAEFLWSGVLPRDPVAWTAEPITATLAPALAVMKRRHPRPHIRHLLMQTVLSLGIAADDDQEPVESAAETIAAARRLLVAMASTFGFLGPTGSLADFARGEALASGLARAFGIPPQGKTLRALDAALILLADHELAPATFAARIAASVGNNLHACIGAALNVMFGSITGLGCDQVEEVLAGSGAAKYPHEADPRGAARILPGFDHPLYPRGDPRAKKLLEIALEIGGGSAVTRQILDAVEDIHANVRAHFTIEEALVVLCRTIGLANDAATGLLALSRVAGWVAHVLEQRQAAYIIRPRGKFVAGTEDAPPSRPH